MGMIRRISGYALVLVLGLILQPLWGIRSARAEETDQFTLPPQPLFDIGPWVSQQVYVALEAALNQTNSELDSLASRADARDAGSADVQKRLSGDYLVELVESRIGEGLPETTLERALHWNDFPAEMQPMRFGPRWAWDTIYWLIFTPTPGSLTLLAPTINMYGHELGTDKIGHFLQEGEGYYELYNKKLSEGATDEQARAAMISFGHEEEHGWYGTALDGVFSNGDLSADYAGWKFYTNISHPVQIGNETLAPMFKVVNGRWRLARPIDPAQLLKPFINDNLNEAWNPSEYFYDINLLRKHVRALCQDWIQRKGLTQQTVDAKLAETSLWNGEDYGHWLPPRGRITLDVCFGGQ